VEVLLTSTASNSSGTIAVSATDAVTLQSQTLASKKWKTFALHVIDAKHPG